jgi:hypothetical protein
MAKTQTIPAHIQNMMSKPQYSIGQAVCIKWLGVKKYGFILKIKKAHEEVSYFVRTNDRTYPCGIQIDTYTTKHYAAGLVQHDCGESQDVITRKASTSNTRVVADANGNPICTAVKNTVSGTNVSATGSKLSTTSKRTGTASRKANEQSSSATNSKTRSRKSTSHNGSELEDAIQRQKDFLKGFTKK